jgi:hypothetical protein
MNQSRRTVNTLRRVVAASAFLTIVIFALRYVGAAAQCGVSVECPFEVYVPSLPAVRPITCRNIILNSGFEDPVQAGVGEASRHPHWWQTSDSGAMPISTDLPYSGAWSAWMGGYPDGRDRIGTWIRYHLYPPDTGIANDLVSAELTYAFAITSSEDPSDVKDVLSVLLVADSDSSPRPTLILDQLQNTDAADNWAIRSLDVTGSFRARPGWARASLEIRADNDAINPTSWFLDDITVVVCERRRW